MKRPARLAATCWAGRVHPPSDAVVAGSRFTPGPRVFRAATSPDAPLRDTRAAAIADECTHLCGPKPTHQEGSP